MKIRIGHRGKVPVVFGLTMILALMMVTGPSCAKRVVSVLAEKYWVPGLTAEIEKQIKEWAGKRGVDVRIDFVDEKVARSKLAVEAESQAGHDIVTLHHLEAALYKEDLAMVDDVAEELGRKYGPWIECARYLCRLDGHWYAIPYNFQLNAATINTKYWREIGFEPDQVAHLTWDSFLGAAEKLHTIGHPVACAISDDMDTENFQYPLLWSFGGRTVDEQGNVVVKSPETKVMLEYLKKIYQYMPPEVTGWTGGDNNMYLHSEIGSWTTNGPTIWGLANQKKLAVLPYLDHVPLPEGPAGRFITNSTGHYGIWKFSPNIDLAKDLLTYLMEKDNYYKQIDAAGGAYSSFLKGYEEHPAWHEVHALRYLVGEAMGELHPYAWPAPPGPAAAIETNMVIIGVAGSKAVTDTPLDEVIAWWKRSLEQLQR